MNKGASKPPAVTGSITIDNSGMPTMENPPPNAPFMKQIRNTPAKVTKNVSNVSVTSGRRVAIVPDISDLQWLRRGQAMPSAQALAEWALTDRGSFPAVGAIWLI